MGQKSREGIVLILKGITMEEFENFSLVVDVKSQKDVDKLNRYFAEGWSTKHYSPLSEDRVFVVLEIPLDPEEDEDQDQHRNQWKNSNYYED